jgi:hypothetical protein
MSSLWTPGGEHPVEPEEVSGTDGAGGTQPFYTGLSDEALSPEERQQAEDMARDMAEVQEQIASAPAAVVVANHLMGFYELAAIHLSQQSPNMSEASVAIDALGAVVEKLPGRLGEAEATMRDALHQIRLAYVSVEKALRDAAENPGPEATDEAE